MTKLKLNLLAAVLAMPLLTMGGAARANETNADQPPMAQGDHGPRGPEHEGPGPGSSGPGQGGPDGPPRGRVEQGGPGPGGPERAPGFGPAFGPGPGFGPAFGRGFGGHPPFFAGVALSEEQQDKVFTILHAEAPYLREQSRIAVKARQALRELATADKYEDAKAAALAKEAATADANIALQHVRTQQKLLAVLTPEQRKQQAEDKPRHPQRP